MNRLFAIFCIAALVVCSGCAVMNRDNTPTLNLVEKKLLPTETPQRYLVYPVLIPVGLGAVAIDALVVHPISVADDAAEDVRVALWRDLDWKNRYATECVLLPPRAVSTPFALLVCFFGRSVFDISPRGGEPHLRQRSKPSPTAPDETARQAELIAKAEQALLEAHPEEALIHATAAAGLQGRRTKEANALKLAALTDGKDFDGLSKAWGRQLSASRQPELVLKHISHLLQNGTVEDRMRMLAFMTAFHTRWLGYERTNTAEDELLTTIASLVESDSRPVAVQALNVVGSLATVGEYSDAKAVLQRIAKGKDPLLAAAAEEFLRPAPPR
jgi:hypothetical protein